VDLPQAYQIHQKGAAIFVDIRSKELYEKGHVPNSLNIHLQILPQTILENSGGFRKANQST
jgi:Rhodanese-related sulfurtransferase